MPQTGRRILMSYETNKTNINKIKNADAPQRATASATTRRQFVALAVGGTLAALAGCSNGGGGIGPGPGPTSTSVTGRVLRAENNAPEPNVAVKIGSRSTTTATDGTFTLTNVDATVKTATITAAAPAIARTVALSLIAKTVNNLGDIFVSDTGYTATATGTVVAPINGTQQPVGNATVTIAGTQVKTGVDGTFRIDNLPVGLGANANVSIGTISAPDFETRQIFAPFVFETGMNPLGTLPLGAPVGMIPPSLPYTVSGDVTVGGKAPTSPVTVSITPVGGMMLSGNTTTDPMGNYTFWVVAGAYTVIALQGTDSRTVNVTLASLDAPVAAPQIAF